MDGFMNTLTLAASNPVAHVTDKPLWGQMAFSNVTFMLVLSAAVTLWLVLPAAKRITTGKRKTLEDFKTHGVKANLVEVVCLYLRDQVFRPLLGDDTDRYCPMLWTFFFFILVNNLLGLVPILDVTAALMINPDTTQPGVYFGVGGTATQSIWVTATLAIISAVWFNLLGITKDPKGYISHMTGGTKFPISLIMFVVEVVGTLVKPTALALRLFANMTGGHIIVATLLMFVGQLAYSGMGGIAGHGMALVPLVGTMAIYMLELMVAFIQAYIFTFLSCLFLSQLVVHHGHDDHHEESHGTHASTAHGH